MSSVSQEIVSFSLDSKGYKEKNLISDSMGSPRGDREAWQRLKGELTAIFNGNKETVSWSNRGNLRDRDIVTIGYRLNGNGERLEKYYTVKVPTKSKFKVTRGSGGIAMLGVAILAAGLWAVVTGGSALSIGLLIGVGGAITFVGLLASFEVLEDKDKEIMLKPRREY